MRREELFQQIHQKIEQSPQWAAISGGNTWTKCREISGSLYQFLTQPEHAIPGLSLALVDGTGYQTNHAWIMAHHADAGFFLIDATAGQFLYSARRDLEMPYHDVFIGSYDELKQMVVDSGEYKTRSNFYSIWPPYMTMTPFIDGGKKIYFYKPEEVDPIWSRCPQKIDLYREPERLVIGAWAAEMERHGLNWRDAIAGRYGTGTHSVPDNAHTWYPQIEAARDEYLSVKLPHDKTQHIRNQIYSAIMQMPLGRHIAEGRVHNQCKDFCTKIYDHLQSPGHAIEGLKLAVVETEGFQADHVWLLAHHPDTGFLIVDPTIAQLAKHKDTKVGYSGPFIGSYVELERTMKNPDTYAKGDEFYAVWSPAIHFYHEGTGQDRKDYYKPEDLPTWKQFEFPIGFERHNGAEREGRWAARMEEEGLDWRKSIAAQYNHSAETPEVPDWLKGHVESKTPAWPDPASDTQMNRYRRICEVRNQHIKLGRYSEDETYQQRLGRDYQPPTVER